jgi:hypothetical protein
MDKGNNVRFKIELNRYYNRMPSLIKNDILPRKLSGDDQKPEGTIPNINR